MSSAGGYIKTYYGVGTMANFSWLSAVPMTAWVLAEVTRTCVPLSASVSPSPQ